MIRFAVGFAIAILLAGSNDEGQEKALAQCEFSALPTYKDGWRTVGQEATTTSTIFKLLLRRILLEYTIRTGSLHCLHRT
jgi:hypothetical protein